jgi:hypothetical protein
MPKKKTTGAKSANKYEKYILRDTVVEAPPRKRPASPYVAAIGDFWKGVEGARCNFAFSYILTAPYMFPETPHTHENDEFLFFVSTDPNDMKNLGATVEIAFGEEWEKCTITTSSVIYFPKGLQHCPIFVKKLDRPFLFGHVWPMGEKTNIKNPD